MLWSQSPSNDDPSAESSAESPPRENSPTHEDGDSIDASIESMNEVTSDKGVAAAEPSSATVTPSSDEFSSNEDLPSNEDLLGNDDSPSVGDLPEGDELVGGLESEDEDSSYSDAEPDSEPRPVLQESPVVPPRLDGLGRRRHLNHCLFASIVSWLGATAMAGMATVLFIVLVRLFGATFEFPQAAVVEPMLVLWIAATGALGIFWTGYCHRTLGIRKRDRLPLRLRNLLDVPSMKDELELLRIAVIVFAVLPFVGSMLHSAVPRIDRDLPPIGYSPVFMFGWVAMMLSGLTVWVCSVPAFRELRAKYLLNSLRFHHRGVALRSFISEWDNPGRQIYRSCRLSRHVSRAHTSIFVSTIACFSFAGCLAGLLDSTRYLGDLMSLVSIAAIASMWPTPKRLVNWSAETLDKFCADREEYEFY
ncbi:hypothetical protein [Neorhodopirellula pilleata]|uniref:Uncharacterized protein n=1 Tax=Neorhodopirellula pilleata TaxID=2714738 RepID=A0A5C5ZZW5_9BACT|nr:hypothetical protein [Neorhodopirellula pilleata]TWT92597.1 hypothetical protein Pla100_46150 [Neorhodopirellula pilleata]